MSGFDTVSINFPFNTRLLTIRIIFSEPGIAVVHSLFHYLPAKFPDMVNAKPYVT